MDKRERLIVSAMHHFSEKGYFSTSVQEITSSCGVAKGTFYKFFRSKEDLLIEVFRYNHQQMLLRAKNVQLDDSLSAKEQLIRKISLELNGLYDNREFFLLLHKVVSVQEHKTIMPLMKKTKAAMMNWHKEWLLEVYGESIQKQVWDLVLFLQGALKEYIGLMDETKHIVDTEKASRKIVARMDVLVNYSGDFEPILTKDIMKDYEQIAMEPEKKTKEEEIKELLEKVKGDIKRSSFTSSTEKEMLQAVELINEELQKQKPRTFLMKALASYIKENTNLEECISTLEQFIVKARE
ncbi:TetR/AcrR family transcriptional regulator [Alteribacillus bidgolensis]|uniref:Transcriptional regulator, TetR family n=1 Tax=Alteribacillus bidgolensis TaxID=930129 RepID=A0A1G8CHD3_9BACI|nr:TetR/AcrR family transcriptional regulator [Alteribacillus bidgolensis]SDH44643.1 transcriptional regulator, TetR family [Alteribacillus bidgolensis]